MKTNVAVLLVGAVAAQILLLGSGCKDPDVLAPRGYQVPQAEPDPEVNYEPAATTRPKTPAAPPASEVNLEIEAFEPQQTPQQQRRAPRAVENNIPTEYTVKKGDTLGAIGQRYGVSAAALAKYNNLDVKKFIRVGQVIQIPPPGTVIHVERAKAAATTAPRQAAANASSAAASATASTASLTDGYYLVRRGDSVSKIAARFKVKRADLMKANSISENTVLQIGQKLVIPGKSPSGTSAVSARKPATTPQTSTPKAAVPPESVPTGAPALPTNQDVDGILEGIEDPTGVPAASTPPSAAATTVSTGTPATPVTPNSLTNRKSIDIPTDTTWEQLSIMYGTTTDELKRMNPDVRDDKTVRAGRILFIP